MIWTRGRHQAVAVPATPAAVILDIAAQACAVLAAAHARLLVQRDIKARA
jgi:hypothetical protein